MREQLSTTSHSHRCPCCGKSNPIPDFVETFQCDLGQSWSQGRRRLCRQQFLNVSMKYQVSIAGRSLWFQLRFSLPSMRRPHSEFSFGKPGRMMVWFYTFEYFEFKISRVYTSQGRRWYWSSAFRDHSHPAGWFANFHGNCWERREVMMFMFVVECLWCVTFFLVLGRSRRSRIFLQMAAGFILIREINSKNPPNV